MCIFSNEKNKEYFVYVLKANIMKLKRCFLPPKKNRWSTHIGGVTSTVLHSCIFIILYQSGRIICVSLTYSLFIYLVPVYPSLNVITFVPKYWGFFFINMTGFCQITIIRQVLSGRIQIQTHKRTIWKSAIEYVSAIYGLNDIIEQNEHVCESYIYIQK